MSDNKSNINQYNLHQLTLSELNFWREKIIIVKDQANLKHLQQIDVRTSTPSENKFLVELLLSYTITYEEAEIVRISLVHSGNFTYSGNPEKKDLDIFMNINAPAIIFPFIREVIANISSKAMIGTILIQPVNFVQLYEDKKKNQGNS